MQTINWIKKINKEKLRDVIVNLKKKFNKMNRIKTLFGKKLYYQTCPIGTQLKLWVKNQPNLLLYILN